MVMPYHLHMPSYFLETFTEYPYVYARGDYSRVRRFQIRIHWKRIVGLGRRAGT